ncbi:hypothetical protein GCWU000246_00984 [Jonquetella anthropi E3_33 E1]|nr:hypothetical protein GCWU000246_00984 [Jonquetella anthropi E3_33 E1]
MKRHEFAVGLYGLDSRFRRAALTGRNFQRYPRKKEFGQPAGIGKMTPNRAAFMLGKHDESVRPVNEKGVVEGTRIVSTL